MKRILTILFSFIFLATTNVYGKEVAKCTIDGVTYSLRDDFGKNLAYVLPHESGSYVGRVYIPDYVTYEGVQYFLTKSSYGIDEYTTETFESIQTDAFVDQPELTSISTPAAIKIIKNCPKLTSIEIREGARKFGYIEECNALESICFPSTCTSYIHIATNCENLKTITFNSTDAFSLYNTWSLLELPKLSDVYFKSDIPPTNDTGSANPNVSVHIPSGTILAYNKAAWENWNLVEDQPAMPIQVKWDYCGNDLTASQSIGVGNGDDDVEFAIYIPKDHLTAYKGCKIASIEYHTRDFSINGTGVEMEPDYVFLTTDDVDYLTKQAVSVTHRGNWTSVRFDKPCTIEEGKNIYAGIGRHGCAEATWANEEVEENGFWLRVMGNDYAGYTPGKWYKHADIYDWNHPLPIRVIIEGDNLPDDVVVATANVVDVAVTASEPSSKAKVHKVESPKVVKQRPIEANATSDSRYFTIERGYSTGSDDSKVSDKIEMPAAPTVHAASRSGEEVKQRIEMKVRNRSPRIVNEMKFNVSIDGKTTYTATTQADFIPNYEGMLYIDLPASLSGRNHDATIDVKELDGKPDVVSANSNAEVSYSQVASKTFPRRNVLEEATGNWCGYCPSGIATIEYLKENTPDRFIPICIHDDDMMPTDSYSPFISSVPSYPSGIMNRETDYAGVHLWDIEWGDLSKAHTSKADARISASAKLLGNGTVEVKTDVEFGFSDDGSTEYRIAYVILEDKVGPYLQANYFSDPETEDNPEELMNWWYHQDSYVSILFDDVARAIFNYDGVTNSLPLIVNEGETYSRTQTLLLPSNVDNTDNVKVVAMVIDTRNGAIMNADCTLSLGDPAGITDITADRNNTSAIYDLCGRRIAKPTKRGIYICNGVKKIY